MHMRSIVRYCSSISSISAVNLQIMLSYTGLTLTRIVFILQASLSSENANCSAQSQSAVTIQSAGYVTVSGTVVGPMLSTVEHIFPPR